MKLTTRLSALTALVGIQVLSYGGAVSASPYKRSSGLTECGLAPGSKGKLILDYDASGNALQYAGSPTYEVISASPDYFTLQVDRSTQFCPQELNDSAYYGYGEVCDGVYALRRQACRNLNLVRWTASCSSGSSEVDLHVVGDDGQELTCKVYHVPQYPNPIAGVNCGQVAEDVEQCSNYIAERDALSGYFTDAALRFTPL
ncbi:hypothetical protein AX16_001148 [Volvariella volvacea WC 439]|nr:hypothetical protein AX16_001148 [Volvariella volvacea WC 439]